MNDFEYDEYDEYVEIRIRRDERDLPDVVRRALMRAVDASFARKLAAAMLPDADDEPRLAPDELFAEEVDS